MPVAASVTHKSTFSYLIPIGKHSEMKYLLGLLLLQLQIVFLKNYIPSGHSNMSESMKNAEIELASDERKTATFNK